jgi:hypothetical protein
MFLCTCDPCRGRPCSGDVCSNNSVFIVGGNDFTVWLVRTIRRESFRNLFACVSPKSMSLLSLSPCTAHMHVRGSMCHRVNFRGDYPLQIRCRGYLSSPIPPKPPVYALCNIYLSALRHLQHTWQAPPLQASLTIFCLPPSTRTLCCIQ